ncbi:AbrB/MazE/SpoVT family DNA-binding domain-containing protein [Nocardia vinacea]|uniref:AbrB/MazE/SpoVT family DNA-binding domain-containing protein n=1 Tax=Nocardia vinacea TaxID=96468 RepID=UPI003440C7F9
MTADGLGSLIPPRIAHHGSGPAIREQWVLPLVRPTPPLAPVSESHPPTTAYGLRAVDAGGRVIDKTVLDALGWRDGTNLQIHDRDQMILVSTPGDDVVVNKRGYLHLPARWRRAVGIGTGDRVLLAANLTRELLLVIPESRLDELIAHHFAEYAEGSHDHHSAHWATARWRWSSAGGTASQQCVIQTTPRTNCCVARSPCPRSTLPSGRAGESARSLRDEIVCQVLARKSVVSRVLRPIRGWFV